MIRTICIIAVFLAACTGSHQPGQWNKKDLLKHFGFDCARASESSRECDTSCYDFHFVQLAKSDTEYLFLRGEFCSGSGYGHPDAYLCMVSPQQKIIRRFNAVDSIFVYGSSTAGHRDIGVTKRLYFSGHPNGSAEVRYEWDGGKYQPRTIERVNGIKKDLDILCLFLIGNEICGWEQLDSSLHPGSSTDSFYPEYFQEYRFPDNKKNDSGKIILSYHDTDLFRCQTWIIHYEDGKYALVQSFRDQLLSPAGEYGADSLYIRYNSPMDSLENAGALYLLKDGAYIPSAPVKDPRFYGDDFDESK
ncbi:MAG TPA: hypothetical protein VFU15_15165 [Bacteroidia bacterium]|nr:hypothetical protein [Bacteroidia bacterium]